MDSRAERELTLRSQRLFFKRGRKKKKKKKSTWSKVRGIGKVWQSLNSFLGEIAVYQLCMKKFDSTNASGWLIFCSCFYVIFA